MSNDSMEERKLSGSWWIGLQVVFAVWFDQLWYWREIRPYLVTNKPKAKLFISTAVVTLIINTLLFITLGLAFEGFGYDFDWQWIGIAVAVINLVLLGTSTYMMLPKKPEMQTLNQWSLPPFIITSMCLTLAIILGLQNFQLFGLACGFVAGVSIGMSLGIVKLTPSTFKESFLIALFYGGFLAIFLMTIPVIEFNVVWIGVTAVLAQAITQFVCGRWATRQLDHLELKDE